MTQSSKRTSIYAPWYSFSLTGAVFALLTVLISTSVHAMQFSSTNYIIDAATLNNTGGYSESANYALSSSGGEAIIGEGASGSYKLAAGYAAQVITPAITISTQPTDLTGYFALDENSGTFIHDSSSNAYTGNFVGTPTWSTGKIETGLSFNGTDQAVLFSNSAQGASAATIEVWLNTTDDTGTHTLIAKHNSWLVGIENGKPILYNFSNSTTCTSTTDVADGTWHAVTVSLQDGLSNGSLIYVDGIQSQSCTWSPLNQAGLVSIGSLYNGSTHSQYFNGSLDQIKIFSRVLSANEVLAEYNAQDAGIDTGLTLQTVIPGVSTTSDFVVTTLTSGSSYSLAINQNHNLQSGPVTIPSVSGSIATPITWNEGTTKGLGFTLTATNATAIPGSWSGGDAYAALPNTATSFYARTGTQTAGTKDTLGVELRLDIEADQESGSYTNTMYVTGTASP